MYNLVTQRAMRVGRIASLIECNTDTTQKFPCAVNTTIELQNISHISQNTATLPSQNVPRKMPVLSDIFDTFSAQSRYYLQMGSYLDCATVALSERYCHLWPVRLYRIFPQDLINSTIFGTKSY